MKISITYCAQWNYKPRASSLGAELQNNYQAEVELIAGSGGVFEISVNGKDIYSKKKTGHFPETHEVLSLIDQQKP